MVEHGVADEVVPLVLEPGRRQLEPEGGLDEQELEYDTDDDDQDEPESPHQLRGLLNVVIGAAGYVTAPGRPSSGGLEVDASPAAHEVAQRLVITRHDHVARPAGHEAVHP